HPISPETAVLATNKLRQRERLATAGVPTARYESVASLEEAEAAAERLGYPCVVKAPDRQGQKGLRRVSGPEGLAEAYEAAHEAARNTLVLVEELVEGPEVTVNAFSLGGQFYPLTVTDRAVAPQPAFGVALAHVWPSGLEPESVGAAVAAARAAAEALGIEDGPAYTQVLVGRDGPRIGELAARLGGGHDAELCEAALRVDLNELALKAALGEEIAQDELRPESAAGGAVTQFLVPPEGTLEAVEGV